MTKEKREGRSGKRAEGFQEFTVTKETTTLKLWKRAEKDVLAIHPVTIYLPHVRGSQPQARDISLPKLYNGSAMA